MKTIYLIPIAVLLLFTSNLIAQKKHSFALKGGVNQSRLHTKIDKYNPQNPYSSSKDKGVLSLDLGIAVEYHFLSDLSLYTSLEFSSKRSEIHLEDEFFPLTINTTRNYIQLPVHANYYVIKETAGISVSLHVGPYLAYGIGGKIKFEGFPTYLDGDQSFNYFKRFDIGIGTGLKIQYDKFGIDAGYNHGLKNLDKEYKLECRNRSFYLALLLNI